MKAVIIGGGLTGLATAYYLGQAKPDWQICVYEQSHRFGGKVQTKRIDGYTVEMGPDSYLARKQDMTQFITDLGLGDKIVANATGQAYIYDQDRLYPIPGGSIVGIPTEFIPFAKSKLISWSGKLRAGLDYFKSPYPKQGDVSIGEFFKYHLGQEMMTKLIEPLLSGIYGGDIYSLSLDAVFPDFHRLEHKAGNLVKGMMQAKQARPVSHRPVKGVFRQVDGGLASIVDAVVAKMPANVRLIKNCQVTQLEYQGDVYRLGLIEKEQVKEVEADTLIITTPPRSYQSWFIKDKAFDAIRGMQQSTCAIAIMSFDADSFDAPIEGTGFVITRTTKTPLTACTYISKKWPKAAAPGKLVFRTFLGKPGDQTVQDHTPEELGQIALRELRKILGFTVNPLWIEVTQLKNSMPQYEVGHCQRIAKVKDHIHSTYPGLYLIGTPYYGVGMPDGVKQARELVAQLSKN